MGHWRRLEAGENVNSTNEFAAGRVPIIQRRPGGDALFGRVRSAPFSSRASVRGWLKNEFVFSEYKYNRSYTRYEYILFQILRSRISRCLLLVSCVDVRIVEYRSGGRDVSPLEIAIRRNHYNAGYDAEGKFERADSSSGNFFPNDVSTCDLCIDRDF